MIATVNAKYTRFLNYNKNGENSITDGAHSISPVINLVLLVAPDGNTIIIMQEDEDKFQAPIRNKRVIMNIELRKNKHIFLRS